MALNCEDWYNSITFIGHTYEDPLSLHPFYVSRIFHILIYTFFLLPVNVAFVIVPIYIIMVPVLRDYIVMYGLSKWKRTIPISGIIYGFLNHNVKQN